MGQKRQRDVKGLSTQSTKRKKVANSSTATDKESSWDGILAADDLEWSEVALPDRLDDAEGFFGLEEIDGVDIIKSGGNGEVRFMAVSGKQRDGFLNKRAAKEEEPDVDDEWSGFSDGEKEKIDVPDAEEVNEVNDEGSDAEADLKDSKDSKDKRDKNAEKAAKLEAKKEARKEARKEAKKAKREQKEQDAKVTNGQDDRSIKSGLSFEALQEEEEDDGVDISAWESLGLSPEILTSLSKMKFGSPTSVQETCIPHILDGHDVIGKASTGSGKTLAFGIPILEYYLERKGKNLKEQSDKKESMPIALILSPTRELAHQLAKHIITLNANAPGADARIALLTGGLSAQKQQRLLTGADIVIGTPGRVWEILSTGQGLIAKMQKAKYLVIDEADRLLSEGHFKEVGEILASLDRTVEGELPDAEEDEEKEEESSDPKAQRQTLVFSATFHRDLQQKLAGKSQWTGGDIMDKKESMEYLLRKLNFREEKPKFIDMNPVSQMAVGLKEGLVECPAMEKDLYLYTLLLYHPKHRTLVFTNSISAVRRLTKVLQNLKLPALALHSSMMQKARLRSVERFSSPTAEPGSILVATDVAARGLDVKGIDLVIHYHPPRAADTYVHRSGRTARAGASGKSVLICAPEEMVGVVRLTAKVHANKTKVKRLPLESLELDRRIVGRVKPRVALATRIADSTIAKEKISAEDNWLRNAAEDLGVEYDSEEFDASEGIGRGRGRGRHEREKKQSNISKAELGGMRAELNHLLSQRVNVGVSERYLTAGRVDIEALLRGEGNASFLGQVDPLDF